MDVIILDNAEAVAELGASRIHELLALKPNVVLGLATGRTPLALYQQLIKRHQQQGLSFAQASTFNLDEYIEICADNPQSYRQYMQRELFDAIDIDPAKTHLPYCEPGANPRQVGSDFERAIRLAGGIDLQVLGLGRNGHIGFNEPGSSLASRTRVKTLTRATIVDNSSLFDKDEFQPHLAMTMGIATILDARQVMLLATGKSKASAVQAAIEGPLSAMCPASALQLHQHATVVLDEAAASQLQNTEYYHWAHLQNEPLSKAYGHFYQIKP